MVANRKPTILVVDDDRAVRQLICTLLQEAGYTVMDAEDGKEALKLFSHSGARIDLLLTDVIMPNMNGRELANRVSSIWPAVRVLFISAYTSEALIFHNLAPHGVEFIKKPFRKEELLDKVGRIATVSFTWKELLAKLV